MDGGKQQGRSVPLNTGGIFFRYQYFAQTNCGRIAEYRHYIAQKARPELFDILRVRPVAVSGLLECEDGLVFGRRSEGVTQHAGSWELEPSGGIDAAELPMSGNCDCVSAILRELREEIGIGPESVSGLRPYCLVEDLDSHVFDIGIAIASPWTVAMVRDAHRDAGSTEYTDLRVVPITELKNVVNDPALHFVPVSKILIQQFLSSR